MVAIFFQQRPWIGVAALPEAAPIAALSVQDSGDGAALIVAGRAGGGLAGFSLSTSGTAEFRNYQAYPEGPSALSGLDLVALDLGGDPLVLPLGPAAGGGYGYGLDDAEQLSDPQALDPGDRLLSPEVGRLTAAVTAGEEGSHLIAATTSGLWSWDLQTGQLAQEQHLALTGDGNQITDLAMIGDDLLLAALADGDAVQSYAVASNGQLTPLAQLGAAEGWGIHTPTALATVQVAGQDFALVGSAGSQSLSVLSVAPNGQLTVHDHIVDTQEGRFGGITALDVCQQDGWTLVSAAGRDGGVSVFALLPSGQLVGLANTAFEGTALGGTVTGLSGFDSWINGDQLHVFAAPEGGMSGEHGLLQLSFDLASLGAILQSNTQNATLQGSSTDDILAAGAPGQRLTGGAGADHFVFAPAVADGAGHLGQISDFTPGEDKIDLSALPLLRTADQISLQQQGRDVLLTYEGYSLVLANLQRGALDLTRDLDLSLQHSALEHMTLPEDPTLYGTAGADRLEDGTGDGVLLGYDGDDLLIGGAGHDQLYGGTGRDTLNGGSGNDTLIGGETANDLRDTVYAGDGDDVIDGGYGNDLLYGQTGNDTIDGGWGADEVIGQEGDDVLNGAVYSDLVFGGAGHDFINGGFGHDRVNGGSGGDRFYHLGILDHGSDWIQDYNAAEGDVLLFGQADAIPEDFQVNLAHTENADGVRSGQEDVAEAFVIYRPTGQIVWALIDGAAQDDIWLKIAGGDAVYDLV